MTKPDTPSIEQLPTTRQLNRATLLAGSVAAVILVTTVLPAEYGIDPTGIGGALGLTAMGLTKQAAAGDAAPAAEAATASDEPVTTLLADGSTQVRLVLKPYQGKEVKATMKAGQEFAYRWSTDGATVEYELHGDPEGAVGDEYSSYEKGDSAGASGTFRAPFDGRHGWYWKNNGNKPVAVTASAKGGFEKFAVLD
jgi:hypothetical protein